MPSTLPSPTPDTPDTPDTDTDFFSDAAEFNDSYTDPWWHDLVVRVPDSPVIDIEATLGDIGLGGAIRPTIPADEEDAAAAVVARRNNNSSDPEHRRLVVATPDSYAFHYNDDTGTFYRDTLKASYLKSMLSTLRDNMGIAIAAIRGQFDTEISSRVAQMKTEGKTDPEIEKEVISRRKVFEARIRPVHKFYTSMGSSHKRNGIVTEVESINEISISTTDLDAVTDTPTLEHPAAFTSFITTANGTLRFCSGPNTIEFLPHSPAFLANSYTDVIYDPPTDADADRSLIRDGLSGLSEHAIFRTYLEDALPFMESRLHLQKIIGSALLGSPRDKLLLNLIGPPDSGKSVFLEVMNNLFGQYSKSINPQTLMQSRTSRDPSAPDPAWAVTQFARLVTASEPSSGSAWDSTRIKTVTGRDKQTTRGMWDRTPTTWTPRFLLVIASNAHIRLSDGTKDQALIQRIHPVAFPIRFLPETHDAYDPHDHMTRLRDTGLPRKLATPEALSEVLNWVLDGLRLYWSDGLPEPDEVKKLREGLVEESSPPLQWLREYRRKHPELVIPEHLISTRIGGASRDPEYVPLPRRMKVALAWKLFEEWTFKNSIGSTRYTKARFTEALHDAKWLSGGIHSQKYATSTYNGPGYVLGLKAPDADATPVTAEELSASEGAKNWRSAVIDAR